MVTATHSAFPIFVFFHAFIFAWPFAKLCKPNHSKKRHHRDLLKNTVSKTTGSYICITIIIFKLHSGHLYLKKAETALVSICKSKYKVYKIYFVKYQIQCMTTSPEGIYLQAQGCGTGQACWTHLSNNHLPFFKYEKSEIRKISSSYEADLTALHHPYRTVYNHNNNSEQLWFCPYTSDKAARFQS